MVDMSQAPVGRDTADLMVHGSSVFYMQSPLPACIFFCVGGYMIHKSWLIALCGCSFRDFSTHVNSSTERHIRELTALPNHDASRRHSAAVQVKVLEINLWVSMLKIQLWNLVGIQSWFRFACNGENRIPDGNRCSSSTLGGSMHLFSRFIQLPFQVTYYVSHGCLLLRTAFLDVFVQGSYTCAWVVEHAHIVHTCVV